MKTLLTILLLFASIIGYSQGFELATLEQFSEMEYYELDTSLISKGYENKGKIDSGRSEYHRWNGNHLIIDYKPGTIGCGTGILDYYLKVKNKLKLMGYTDTEDENDLLDKWETYKYSVQIGRTDILSRRKINYYL